MIIVSILGLIIGSFLNVCIYRIPKGENIAYPPSHCFNCGIKLKPIDLIPIISFLSTKGRCRYCGDKISLQYPLVELLNGVLYLLLFLKFGFTFIFIKFAILFSVLVVITLIDLKHQIIPDSLNFIIFILGIFNLAINFNITSIYSSILGLFIGGGILLLIAIISNGAMGGGDIKLIASLGFLFGLKKILLIIFLSFILGAVISIILLVFKIKNRKDFIPFGPFIAVSTVIVVFYYFEILSFYLRTLI